MPTPTAERENLSLMQVLGEIQGRPDETIRKWVTDCVSLGSGGWCVAEGAGEQLIRSGDKAAVSPKTLLRRKSQVQNGITCAKAHDTKPRLNT